MSQYGLVELLRGKRGMLVPPGPSDQGRLGVSYLVAASQGVDD